MIQQPDPSIAPQTASPSPVSQPLTGASDPRYDEVHMRKHAASVLSECRDSQIAAILRPQGGRR